MCYKHYSLTVKTRKWRKTKFGRIDSRSCLSKGEKYPQMLRVASLCNEHQQKQEHQANFLFIQSKKVARQFLGRKVVNGAQFNPQRIAFNPICNFFIILRFSSFVSLYSNRKMVFRFKSFLRRLSHWQYFSQDMSQLASRCNETLWHLYF